MKMYFKFAQLIKAAFYLTCICLSIQTANAITVKGSKTCEEWTKIRSTARLKSSGPEKISELSAKFWVVGYLSGLSEAQFEILKNDPLHEASNEYIFQTIDLFCLSEPKKNLQDASLKVWLEIAQFKKKP